MIKGYKNIEEKFDKLSDKERLEKVRIEVGDGVIKSKGGRKGSTKKALEADRMPIIDKIKQNKITVGDLVKNKYASFSYYRSGNLIYTTSDGFEFPIPISDTGEASFNGTHKALELMRWIRKQFDEVKNGV